MEYVFEKQFIPPLRQPTAEESRVFPSFEVPLPKYPLVRAILTANPQRPLTPELLSGKFGVSQKTVKTEVWQITKQLGLAEKTWEGRLAGIARLVQEKGCEIRIKEKPPLTERQRELLGLAAGGLRERRIATAMGVKLSTVKNTKTRIFEALGVNDVNCAVLRAIRWGLLDLSELARGYDYSRISLLSEREKQILSTMIDVSRGNLSGKEMARELTIVFSTMKNHQHNIYRKLGVNSAIQAAIMFLAWEEERNKLC